MSRAGGSGRHGDGIRDHPVIDGPKLLAFPGQMRLAERMRIERWDSGDTATAMACYEVFLTAHAADEPIEPPDSAGTFCTFLAKGHQRMPSEVWTAAPAVAPAAGYAVAAIADATGEMAAITEIAVNEALGYEVAEPGYRHCELAVAGVR
jgi:hypothetical protein